MPKPHNPSRRHTSSGNVLPFVKKAPPKQASKYAAYGAFGTVDRSGRVALGKADRMEIALLAALTENAGRYVFKRCCGTYGYLDDKEKFVPVG